MTRFRRPPPPADTYRPPPENGAMIRAVERGKALTAARVAAEDAARRQRDEQLPPIHDAKGRVVGRTRVDAEPRGEYTRDIARRETSVLIGRPPPTDPLEAITDRLAALETKIDRAIDQMAHFGRQTR